MSAGDDFLLDGVVLFVRKEERRKRRRGKREKSVRKMSCCGDLETRGYWFKGRQKLDLTWLKKRKKERKKNERNEHLMNEQSEQFRIPSL